ncbi:hypothetical protein LIER_20839 [Lithospermum erythrorhizon]|uniref:Uncharacterized protein n=1 Tax=Lithospermum erythrorhizon TaxID=34254 RepID=A0AAV3QQT4_LITER
MPASSGDDYGGSAVQDDGEQTSWRLNMSKSAINSLSEEINLEIKILPHPYTASNYSNTITSQQHISTTQPNLTSNQTITTINHPKFHARTFKILPVVPINKRAHQRDLSSSKIGGGISRLP